MSVGNISGGQLTSILAPLTGWKLFFGGAHCGCTEKLKARNSVSHWATKMLTKLETVIRWGYKV